MPDPLVLGIAILFSVAFSPVIIYGAVSGFPAELLQPSKSATATITVDTNSTTTPLQPFEIRGNNPEQVLANAYNQSAYSEITRCTSGSMDNSLCNTTMSMLIRSCQDNTTWVGACDDPRLANYRADLLVR